MTTRSATDLAPAAPNLATAPRRALGVLFFAETWERFSFYGMRALLVLYMTKHFRLSDDAAYVVYGSYTALVYTTPLIGGALADRLLGARKAVLLGGVLMALGHFAMAFERLFYVALALLCCGNGFFKPNISTIVGKVYPDEGQARDRAFYFFYMGINLGALLQFVCGVLAASYGWHWGFGLAGFGMLLGLGVFLWGQRFLGGAADPPDPERLREPVALGLTREWLVYGGTLLGVLIAWQLVQHGELLGNLLAIVSLGVLGYLLYFLRRRATAEERSPLFVALVLTVFSSVFWAFFEQTGSSMTLFTDRNIDRHFLGHEIATSTFQSVNPAFILLLTPLFAGLWRRLGPREPSTPLKFGLAVLQLALGFGALWLGAVTSRATGIVPLVWLLLGYLLHTSGELCLSPIGLSMITKLSPARIVGLMMGTWFLSTAVAQYVAAAIARLTGVQGAEGAEAIVPPPTETVMVYGSVFGSIAIIAFVIGAAMCALAPALARRMGHVR